MHLGAPEGWYEYSNGNVIWKVPANENVALWLYVLDGADRRVIPPLSIRATFKDANNNEIRGRLCHLPGCL